jgi:hypothetical protein
MDVDLGDLGVPSGLKVLIKDSQCFTRECPIRLEINRGEVHSVGSHQKVFGFLEDLSSTHIEYDSSTPDAFIWKRVHIKASHNTNTI